MQRYENKMLQSIYEQAALAAIMGGCDQRQAEKIAEERVTAAVNERRAARAKATA
jgi:hypothetical protein